MTNTTIGRKALEDLFSDLTDGEILSSKIRHEISRTIIESRLKKKMSQSEFAKALGVTQGLVSRWESGDYNFTVNSLAQIATKLGMEIANPLCSARKYEVNNSSDFSFTASSKTVNVNYKDVGGLAS